MGGVGAEHLQFVEVVVGRRRQGDVDTSFLLSYLEFLIGHDRVMGGDVLGVIDVHVRIHPDALGVQDLVVLGSGERGQAEELH
jgi:hypothetical protein